ncbi:hypothetical protein ACFWXH_22280 [Mesorhizobium sp. NPDC059054]|uniref:hypothetical protein n=1 Tax=Mesorhizobium sp. NPDC059054 TaxID=3346711 RepID=UPI00367E9E31
MRIERLIVPAALAGFLAAPALAEDANRFKLEKTNEGYVRMDTQTGAMSICNERDGQLVCRVAADERSAFQDEVDRLQGTIKTLDERVTKLENSLAARLESKLPSEEEFNKTMGYMERFVRGFMGIVKDMEKDGDPTKPGLQKT